MIRPKWSKKSIVWGELSKRSPSPENYILIRTFGSLPKIWCLKSYIVGSLLTFYMYQRFILKMTGFSICRSKNLYTFEGAHLNLVRDIFNSINYKYSL